MTKAKWYPKGDKNPFYGKRHSAESIAKMQAAKLGKKRNPLSEELKHRISVGNKGKYSPKGSEHYNWKGGITTCNKSERQKFRELLQPEILERDNYTCQVCDQYSGYLQVDHMKSWADYPELRFDKSNCRTLCMACHYYVTFKRKLPNGVVWGHNLKHRRIS